MAIIPLIILLCLAAWRVNAEMNPMEFPLLFRELPVDLHVYLLGADDALGGLPLYDGDLLPGLPFTYPPFAVGGFMLLRQLSDSHAAMAWQSFMFACLLAVVLMVFHERKRKLGVLTILAAVAVALASFALTPVRSSFFFGQINMLLMFLVFVDVLYLRKLGGIGVGLAAGLKLTPAFTGLIFLLERRWVAALVSIATFGATVVAGFFFVPDAARFWTEAMFDSTRVGVHENPGAQSLHSVLVRAGYESSTLWLVVAVVVTLLVAWAAWAALKGGNRSMAAAIVGVGSCLVSPFSWHHHWVWMVPLLLSLALTIGNYIRAWKPSSFALRQVADLVGLAVALACAVPYLHFIVWPEVSQALAWQQYGTFGLWLYVGAAVVFIAVYAAIASGVLWYRRRRGVAGAGLQATS
ncbi:MAG TPA: DUF2029 domain-containing protein [Candidatus Corynebacterium gallistercoris]|uniref:DUF2029 domain-containing protein n=1 Tax=Candidatus Corynebacterium gallistercoris TaxID=2838530 RepID=A0A9D1UQ29_9CORY|nr:DUF2029 domain-containing protein [Candidatus Corynebacterium gallistercoris]